MADDLKMRIQHGDRTYELDMGDLNGHEMGLLDRFQAQYGPRVGAVYAGILIAKRRGGERATEDSVLNIKWADISDPDEDAAEPEGDAGPPARSRARGAK